MKQVWKKYLLYGSAVIIGLVLIWAGYSAAWTGFGDYTPPNGDGEFVRGKTLWDWMELLVIPLVLALGAFFLQRSERAVEREMASDRQQEAALQAYLDRMAELLLNEKSLKSEKVLNVARVRTLTVMRGLNAARKDIVLRFLRDVGLVGKLESKLFVNANLEGVDLENADLRETNLQNANLQGANLKRANLQGANLKSAKLLGCYLENANLRESNLAQANLGITILTGAKLEGANLQDSILSGSTLHGTHLPGANLKGADLSHADLQGAYLYGANLEDAYLYGAKLEGARVTPEELAIAIHDYRTPVPDD